LKLFQALYEVERQAREQNLSFEQRKTLRQNKSVEKLQEIEAWLKENIIQVLPRVPLDRLSLIPSISGPG